MCGSPHPDGGNRHEDIVSAARHAACAHRSKSVRENVGPYLGGGMMETVVRKAATKVIARSSFWNIGSASATIIGYGTQHVVP